MKKQVLLVIETSGAYGRGIIEGVSRFIRKAEPWTIFFEEQGVLSSVPSWLKNWRGDGIICRTGLTALGLHLRNLELPLVELLGDGKEYVSEIQSDASLAGAMAADHFIEKGVPHFGYYSYGNSWWGEQRGDAFVKSLKNRGKNCFVFSRRHGAKTESIPQWKSLYDEPLREWLTEIPKPIGIWCAADTVAHRVHAATLRLGFRIPDDVAILGICNDRYLCNIVTPSLSSIDPNSVAVGYQAAALLSEKMATRRRASRTLRMIKPLLIPPIGIIARQSTDLIAVDDPEMIRIGRAVRDRALTRLNVNTIADEFDISRRTLERRYQKAFGRTIDKEIFLIRIEHAKRLLRETFISVSEVGEQVGFDGNYFIKAFHRHEGVSPRTYRKRHQVSGRPVVSSDDPEIGAVRAAEDFE